MAGLLLALPDLLALDLPALVTAAGYPGTRDIPAISYLLSLLAVKPTGTRRVSHVHDLAADPGAALFAGLTALPKTTALTSYSYRLHQAKQKKFLTALDKAAVAAGLATGEVLNLDFHAVMHWGEAAMHRTGRRHPEDTLCPYFIRQRERLRREIRRRYTCQLPPPQCGLWILHRGVEISMEDDDAPWDD